MRQFVLSAPPDADGSVVLGARDYRYLFQVLRKGEGDCLDARLPDGSLREMRVVAIDRSARTVRLEVVPSRDGSAWAANGSRALQAGESGDIALAGSSMPALSGIPENFPEIILFQWILKGPRMDQVVRQATETGVSLIVPVAGERCLATRADGSGGKSSRWDRIVREALQQSGSPVPTQVLSPVDVAEIPELWMARAATQSVALVLTEAPLARRSLHGYLDSACGATAIAIGPEGGMTAREISLLEGAGFACVHFKTNVLRAETAALYGIAAVQSALLESGNWQLRE